MKFAIILVAMLACQAYSVPSSDSKILKTLQTKKTANVIVSIKGNNVAALRNRFSISTQSFTTRSHKLTSLYSILKDHADTTQAKVLNVLNEQKLRKPIVVKQLWISNEIIVRNADLSVVEQLLSMDEVTAVREERIFQIEKPVNSVSHPEGQLPQADVQWGIAAIHAPEVWALGNKGAGSVVGGTDSGVRVTHEALRDNYRKEYGWFDPYSGTDTPNDSTGHGTHTTGSMVGRTNGIGVAPEAQWIACKGCNEEGCTETALLECGQWHTCPTDPQGKNPDCSKAPNGINNSWAGGQGESFYEDVIAAWKALDIPTFFSIGNGGIAGCGSAMSPGDNIDAIGVGSTTEDDEASYFSSKGPTKVGNRIKPDISAPGSSVRSADFASDTSYSTHDGTSMASPHVLGLAALLYSENPKLTYNQFREALIAGAQPTLGLDKTCAGISDNQFPNHHVGYGRVDALASLQYVKKF